MQDTKLKVGDRVKLIQKGSGIYDWDNKGAEIYAIVVVLDPFTVCFENNTVQKYGYDYDEHWFEKVGYTSDNVNSPAHYNNNHKGIECIDAMEAMLTPEEFLGYLRGNMFKYSWRFRYKNGTEDVAKHQWYTDKLNKHLEQYPHLAKGEK